MSACYPRLGQNTPLVQKREKKKRRDSLTNQHSTTEALHNHYAKTDTTSQSLMRRQTKISPIETILTEKKKTDEEERRTEMSKSIRLYLLILFLT